MKKHDILTGLASSVALTLLVGIVEILLTCTECACSAAGQKSVRVQDIVVAMMVVFQGLETLMTAIDFSFVTLTAKKESNQLFNSVSKTEMNDAWCTSMVNTSSVCIGNERGMSEMLFDGVASEEMKVGDRFIIIVVVFQTLFMSIGAIMWCNKDKIRRCRSAPFLDDQQLIILRRLVSQKQQGNPTGQRFSGSRLITGVPRTNTIPLSQHLQVNPGKH